MTIQRNNQLRPSSKALCFIAILFLLHPAADAKKGTKDRPKTEFIVLHSIGGFGCKDGVWTHYPSFKKLSNAAAYLAKSDVKVGAHFVVARDGNYEESTPEGKVASHVYGRQNKSDKFSYNQRSIGIEMLNNGDGKDPYPSEQVDAVVALLKDLVNKYSLEKSSIKTHSELDKRKVVCGQMKYLRRIDPGPSFPLTDVIDRVFD